MNRLLACGFVYILLACAVAAPARANDDLLDLLESEGTPIVTALASGLIDYAAMRHEFQTRPERLRRELEACGACPQRASLEERLRIAERDRQMLGAIESWIAGSSGMDPWMARKLGIPMIPDHVLKGPKPCITLYDRAATCAADHDDRASFRLESPCHAAHRLYRLCADGKAAPFNEYVQFLQRRSRGEMLSETDGARQIIFYNVKPGTVLPRDEVKITASLGSYTIHTDNQQPNALRFAEVRLFPWTVGPPVMYGSGVEFREPWKTIVEEDNRALGEHAPVLRCYYKLEDNASGWVHTFWYRSRPAAADPARLSARMENHPLLRVGGAVDHCPETAPEALALQPRIDAAGIRAMYANVLGTGGRAPPATRPPVRESPGSAARRSVRERPR